MQKKITIEAALAHILTHVRSDTSETFFPSMALRLAEALKADYTEIGELLEDNRTVRTLSLVAQGKIVDNITYDLTDTPCDNVVAKTICSYASGVAGLFPKDILLRQMGVEGYVGVPLFDSQQRPIGIMAAFYQSPVDDPSLAETILQLFALRVASEIERRRTEELLIRTRVRFNTLYDHSPIPIWEEDFSQVKEYFDSLRASGVRDLRSYFDAHPESVIQCAGLVRILDVSQESVAFFGVADKEEVVRNLPFYFTEKSLPMFRDELVALWEGKLRFACEIPILDMQRQDRTVALRLSIAPGHEQTWDMVLVSFTDITARRRAEDILQESERRYRDMFEANPHPMWVFDLETLQFLSVNDAAVAHYGYGREEFLSMTIKDIRPAQDLPHLQDALERAAKNPGINKSQVRHRKRDGTLIYVDITSHALDVGGRRARLITANDITERKKADEALIRSEARLREAQRIGRIGNWELDIASCRLWWSDEVYELFGVKAGGGLSFETFLQRIHPEDRQRVSDVIRDAEIRNMTSWQFEYRIIMDNGDVRYMYENATAELDTSGQAVSRRGIVQDVTERKRSEEKLITIMKAVESTSDAVGISNAQGHHFFQNKALSDLFGYTTAEELEAAGGGPIVVKDPVVAKEIFTNIMSGRSWAGELEMVTKNGRVFPAYERADAIKDNDGKIVGLIGIITDITERRKADDELHLFKELVEHSADAIGMSTPEGKHYFQNETFDRMFGKIGDYPPETVYVDKTIGKQVFDTIMSGGSWQGEVKMFRSDGTIMDILLRAYAIKNRDSRIIGLVGLHTDITKRKRAEESLRQSEERFAS